MKLDKLHMRERQIEEYEVSVNALLETVETMAMINKNENEKLSSMVNEIERLQIIEKENERLRTENTRLKNEKKVYMDKKADENDSVVEDDEDDETVEQRETVYVDVDNNVDNDTSETEEECCCCETFVRGMSEVHQEITKLQNIIDEKHIQLATNNSTILELNSEPGDNETPKKFEWENHSSGAAREVMNKMGYKGSKGLGKNENGIEEALTLENFEIHPKKKPIASKPGTSPKPDTLIFSSSITRSINQNGLNKLYKNKTAKIHKFHGRTSKDIKTYMPVNLKEDHPKSVVIMASGNGVPIGEHCSIPLMDIVDDVVQSGVMCKQEYNVKNVYISAFLPRVSAHYQSRRYDLNKLLKEKCRENGFTFMGNTNISLSEHICHDGVHLNPAGSSLLCKNLLYYLNKED